MSTTPSASVKVEICSNEVEEQKPPLLASAAQRDDKFTTQMVEALRRSMIERGMALPSPPRNRGAQIERHVKAKPPSHSRNRDVRIKCRMKEEPPSQPCRQPGGRWHPIILAIKVEEPTSLPRHYSRLHYYLKSVNAFASLSRSKAEVEAAHPKWHMAAFAKSKVAPP